MSQEKEIEKWLAKSGYPLEMRVASAFRSVGFRVTQSTYLNDIETQKPREVDLIATWQQSVKNGWWMNVSFVIECKSTTNKPWVFFTGDATEDLGSLFWLSWFPSAGLSGEASGFLTHFHELLNEWSFFKPTERMAYSATEAFTQGQDKVYESINKIVGVAESMVALTERRIKPGFRIVEYVFPLVITDAEMFNVSLNDQDKLKIESTSEALLPLRKEQSCLVRILALNMLDDFTEMAMNDARTFTERFADALLEKMEFGLDMG
ncbi:hypothetical protein [uncultured Gimesia sp.]|uniref:hypothetical protein n=1 Tax=uncultured Gimesia sp. TaxID=1678688 RepID=UPI0030D8AA51